MSRDERAQTAQNALAKITPLIQPGTGSTRGNGLNFVVNGSSLHSTHQDLLELTRDGDNSGGAAALYSVLAINDWVTGEGKYKQMVLQNMKTFQQGHPNFQST